MGVRAGRAPATRAVAASARAKLSARAPAPRLAPCRPVALSPCRPVALSPDSDRPAANTPGPYAARAGSAYDALRAALVANVLRQLDESGFLYEQYDPDSGRGQRTRPFNGWTTTVLLALAEIY
jgi:hypothetical protein